MAFICILCYNYDILLLGVLQMEQKQPDMLDLEQSMASFESIAKEEEQQYANANFEFLDNELESAKKNIQFPDTSPYATGDYDEHDKIQYEKRINRRYQDRVKELTKYCDCRDLYQGHVRINDNDYFITDQSYLSSFTLNDNSAIINTDDDDKRFKDIVNVWRNPKKDPNSEFSRNIVLSGRHVDNVDIVFDRSSSEFSDITDRYLRQALLRNKKRTGIRSIIQTIQEKQDKIRCLPKDSSFIVQGCAGSGKTMILLHRLRYLIYNKELFQGEYVLLVPSNEFKNFIKSCAANFNISESNIVSYKDYYQLSCKTKTPLDNADYNELVFPENYLATVYSKDFIKQCYKKLFDSFSEQIDIFIELCENRLDEIRTFESSITKQEIENIESSAIAEAKSILYPLASFIDGNAIKSFDDIPRILNKLTGIYKNQKDKYDKAVSSYTKIAIAPDDARILENQALLQLEEKIANEEESLKKASVFTVTAHRNKLNRLKENYKNEKSSLISTLIAEEKAKREKEVEKLSFICESVAISSVEKTISDLKVAYDSAATKTQHARSELRNIETYIGNKYPKEIGYINSLIEFSGNLSSYEKDFVENLSPCYELFFDKMKGGKEVLDGLFKNSFQENNGPIKNKLTFFLQESDNRIYNAINRSLFNICKKEIRSSFDIEICNKYKHYWYLSLYCKYLTRPIKFDIKKYIFMDEAQDLNISEIELINKLNKLSLSKVQNGLTVVRMPIMNLFGDIKQTITTYGICDWALLSDLIPAVYSLNENFRNTNQIIAYCNRNLSTAMESVGVDLAEVSEYPDFSAAFSAFSSASDKPIFIVKDEYAHLDLNSLLKENKITEPNIYTVKSVKGLEFKEIFVFDSGMTDNEKYISYTRALSKLNVIHSLPAISDRGSKLFDQGGDTDEYEE